MPRRARVRQGDRQAAKRAGKNEIAARKGGSAAAATEKQPFEAQKEEGRRKKFFCAPPLFTILTAWRKYYTRNCILFEFAVSSAAFLLQIIVFSEKICYT